MCQIPSVVSDKDRIIRSAFFHLAEPPESFSYLTDVFSVCNCCITGIIVVGFRLVNEQEVGSRLNDIDGVDEIFPTVTIFCGGGAAGRLRWRAARSGAFCITSKLPICVSLEKSIVQILIRKFCTTYLKGI